MPPNLHGLEYRTGCDSHTLEGEAILLQLYRGEHFAQAVWAALSHVRRWRFRKHQAGISTQFRNSAWESLAYIDRVSFAFYQDVHIHPCPHTPLYWGVRKDIEGPDGSTAWQCLGCDSVMYKAER